jgi:hypothetical protein
MPKYNLMDNKDPDSLDQQFDKEIKKTEKPEKPIPENQPLKIEQFEQPEEEDSQISENVFDSAAISSMDDEMDSSAPEINIPKADEVPESVPEPEKHKTPEYVKSDLKPLDLETDYDEKQPGLNYRPVFYIVGAIIVIIAIYLGISNFFFSNDAKEDIESVAESPEQRMQREQKEQHQRFLASVSSVNESRLDRIVSLIDIRPSNIIYSSILLYGESLTIEVFARNRNDLAAFNLILKNSPIIADYNIETVDTRPGKNGGLFALYDIKIRDRGTSSTPTTTPAFTQISPSAWVSNLQLQIKSQRQISSGKENQFSLIRQEYVFRGSEQKCHNLIKQMLASTANYRIHKLSLLPSNQTNMSTSSYQMKLIVDFYM